MKKDEYIFLSIIGFFFTLIIIQDVQAQQVPALNIPPTNAFDKIHSDNGTINAINFSMPINIHGGGSVSVKSNNSTHTVTISTSGSAIGSGTYNVTQANNININTNGYKINFINGTGNPVNVLNSKSGTQVNVTISSSGSGSSGTYNTVQANNVNINTNGQKINFINGTNTIINVLNSHSSSQVNVTVSSFLPVPHNTSKGTNTIYQNTSGKTMIINTYFEVATCAGVCEVASYTGNSSPPTTQNGVYVFESLGNAIAEGYLQLIVLPNQYYEVKDVGTAGTNTVIEWVEFY